MEVTRLVVALVLAMVALFQPPTAVAETVIGDVTATGVEVSDHEGRTFGLLKKPLFFSGPDSIVETSLDNIGPFSGGIGNFLSGLTNFRPFRPGRPTSYRPLRPSVQRPFRPSTSFGYGFPGYNAYAANYGYGPYGYDYGPYYNGFRYSKDYDDFSEI